MKKRRTEKQKRGLHDSSKNSYRNSKIERENGGNLIWSCGLRNARANNNRMKNLSLTNPKDKKAVQKIIDLFKRKW